MCFDFLSSSCLLLTTLAILTCLLPIPVGRISLSQTDTQLSLSRHNRFSYSVSVFGIHVSALVVNILLSLTIKVVDDEIKMPFDSMESFLSDIATYWSTYAMPLMIFVFLYALMRSIRAVGWHSVAPLILSLTSLMTVLAHHVLITISCLLFSKDSQCMIKTDSAALSAASILCISSFVGVSVLAYIAIVPNSAVRRYPSDDLSDLEINSLHDRLYRTISQLSSSSSESYYSAYSEIPTLPLQAEENEPLLSFSKWHKPSQLLCSPQIPDRSLNNRLTQIFEPATADPEYWIEQIRMKELKVLFRRGLLYSALASASLSSLFIFLHCVIPGAPKDPHTVDFWTLVFNIAVRQSVGFLVLITVATVLFMLKRALTTFALLDFCHRVRAFLLRMICCSKPEPSFRGRRSRSRTHEYTALPPNLHFERPFSGVSRVSTNNEAIYVHQSWISWWCLKYLRSLSVSFGTGTLAAVLMVSFWFTAATLKDSETETTMSGLQQSSVTFISAVTFGSVLTLLFVMRPDKILENDRWLTWKFVHMFFTLCALAGAVLSSVMVVK